MRIRSTEHAVLVHDTDVLERPQEAQAPGAVQMLLPADDTRLSPYLASAFNPDDPMARLARSVRLSISALPLPEEPPIRSVAVLGADAGFEASIMAANLAIAYAQGGTPTVLVDANLDDPAQHMLFGLPEGTGLYAALADQADIRAVVERAPVRNLSAVTAGQPAIEAPVLLDGERFHRRVMPLLETFGMMIVDASAAFNEPPALCEAVDAALIVVRRNVTSVDDVAHMVRRLTDMNTHVVGTIMVR